MIIFGASGDLTQRKLIPALYSLMCDGLLPDEFAMIGFARKAKTNESFREEMRIACEEFARSKPINEAVWDKFARSLHYQQGDYSTAADYEVLCRRLEAIERAHGSGANRLFYLSTPPEVYPTIIENVGTVLCTGASGSDSHWSRIIIEKPFGHDLKSARELNDHVGAQHHPAQRYRLCCRRCAP